ncbi:hypothetical protein BH758_12220 [Enterococcus hirae]|uniref:hypothetical protein n=1 Tax=Enterococcus TaxID=1350 RepID=UPI0009BF3D66|nr:hypothetical protein BH758_12220 [Enterococcus hirae]OQO48670.1 hypothetical protein BH735_11940 [Enterococcus hirae]OQO59100.1 hypothetical protein BH740_12580 [Enterococcus hirae]
MDIAPFLRKAQKNKRGIERRSLKLTQKKEKNKCTIYSDWFRRQGQRSFSLTKPKVKFTFDVL